MYIYLKLVLPLEEDREWNRMWLNIDVLLGGRGEFTDVTWEEISLSESRGALNGTENWSALPKLLFGNNLYLFPWGKFDTCVGVSLELRPGGHQCVLPVREVRQKLVVPLRARPLPGQRVNRPTGTMADPPQPVYQGSFTDRFPHILAVSETCMLSVPYQGYNLALRLKQRQLVGPVDSFHCSPASPPK